MEQVLRVGARTTEAIHRAIHYSQASVRALVGHYGISPKTIAKWKGRRHAANAPMGPKKPCLKVLTKEGETIGHSHRRRTMKVHALTDLPARP